MRTLGIVVAAEMRTTPGGALVIVKWPSSEVVTELWKPVAVAETLTPPSCPEGSPLTTPSISAPLATLTRTPSIGWPSERTRSWGVELTVFVCAVSR